MMAITATIAMIPVLFFMFLLPLGLLVALQVWLCRRGGKWLGLILPALNFLLSLVLVLSFSAQAVYSGGGAVRVTDEYGNVIQEEYQEGKAGITPAALGTIAVVFLVGNIPTVVFGGIWLHFKNRRDWKQDLNKMNIQDLG